MHSFYANFTPFSHLFLVKDWLVYIEKIIRGMSVNIDAFNAYNLLLCPLPCPRVTEREVWDTGGLGQNGNGFLMSSCTHLYIMGPFSNNGLNSDLKDEVLISSSHSLVSLLILLKTFPQISLTKLIWHKSHHDATILSSAFWQLPLSSCILYRLL